MKNRLNLIGLTSLIIALVLLITGCGSDGDGRSETMLATEPASFDASNATIVSDNTASLIRIRYLSAYLRSIARQTVGDIIIGALKVMQSTGITYSHPADVCIQGGEAMVSWSDADNSGNLTPGDTVMIRFNDCTDEHDNNFSGTYNLRIISDGVKIDLLSESIDIMADNWGQEGIRSVIVTNHSIEEFISAEFSTVTYSWDDNLAQYAALYEGSLDMIRGAIPLVSLYGCGSMRVSHSYYYDVASSDISGVQNIKDLGVFTQITKSGLDYPSAGVIDFESGSEPCKDVSGTLGVDGDGSLMTLTASDDGSITLNGISADGTPFEVMTSW